MVSMRAPSTPNVGYVDPSSIRCVGDRRARTKKAAEHAVRIAAWVEARANMHNNAEPEEPDEHALFAALQVCAYRATREIRSRSTESGRSHEWAQRWLLIRDYLINQNLGLAHMMLARFQTSHPDRDDLRGEAFLALIRAAERFNPWRGFRFSTYACHSIVRSLIQTARKATRHGLRFLAEPDVEREPPIRKNDELDLRVDRLRLALHENRGELTERESTVLAGRFPMGGGAGRTLSQIGVANGLSKERVRQIQNTALAKLRGVLETDPTLQ